MDKRKKKAERLKNFLLIITTIVITMFCTIVSIRLSAKLFQESTEKHVVTVVDVYEDASVLGDGEIIYITYDYYVVIEMEDGYTERINSKTLYDSLKDRIGERVELTLHIKRYHNMILRHSYTLE